MRKIYKLLDWFPCFSIRNQKSCFAISMFDLYTRCIQVREEMLFKNAVVFGLIDALSILDHLAVFGTIKWCDRHTQLQIEIDTNTSDKRSTLSVSIQLFQFTVITSTQLKQKSEMAGNRPEQKKSATICACANKSMANSQAPPL